MSEKDTLVHKVKKQLLSLDIKSECCKSSFITGTQIFARSRKNEFTAAVAEYKDKLIRKKRKSFFDDGAPVGYVCAEDGDGQSIPVSSGRVCAGCFSAMVRGAFLVCGRASCGEKGIHVEMVVPGESCAALLAEHFAELEFPPKQTQRRGERLLYYKKYQYAEDFLTYIGASGATLELMNTSIVSSLRRSVNRQINCDTGNIQKTVNAAERQMAAINAIIENGALSDLPATLRKTAQIRLENPIDSLESITLKHGGDISRSGVNHRLAKIVEFAEKKGYLL